MYYSKNRSVWKQMIVMAFALVLIAGALPVRAADIQHVSPQELKKMIESKKNNFLVVDAQPKAVYDAEHIKGAISFPWDADLKSPGKLPKDKLIIIYCDCAHEEDAISVATQLMEKWGYTKVKTLEGGWSGWLKLGYPTEKKAKK